MPIYEYACEKCGHEFEREQRISDPPIRSCPECRARRVRKLISRTSFVLKGSGWYKDLYSSGKPTGTDPDKKKTDKKEKKESSADKAAASAKPSPTTPKSSSSGDSGSKPKAAA